MTHHRCIKEEATLVVRQSPWSADPAIILQQAKRDPKIVYLHLLGVSFTEKLLHALTELLQSRRFSFVYIHQCHTMDLDCRRLGRALANQVTELLMDETGELLNILLEQRSFRIQSLTVRLRRHGLTDAQCLLLGKRMANSPELKGLSLKGTDIHAPALLAPGIATSHHLEKLVLADTSSMSTSSARAQQQALADLVVSLDHQYGIGAVLRLLLSPSSRLKVLDLSNLHLQDEHAAILAQALTTNTSLEQLNLSFNDIGCAGIIQLAQQLPNIHHLRKLSLKPNPWVGGEALLEGMQRNVSIEYLDSLLMIPQAPMLRYYTVINRGGRRMLSSRANVPWGLWPVVLERAWKISYGVVEERQAKLNALFYLLKNGPVLFQRY